jgi:AcrR family transcriptional regulator
MIGDEANTCAAGRAITTESLTWIVICGSLPILVRQSVLLNPVTVTPGRRRYTMGARADAVARTRQQIIDAAADRVRASAEPLTLLDVAARAGVSRATLYRHFASVTALLDAVAADLLARARFDRLLAALEAPDPVQALRLVVAAGTGIWAADTALVRNLLALTRVQPEAVPVIAQLERGRLAALERLVDRLHQAGRLRGGLGRARAVDLLLVTTAFAAWDELRATRHRSAAAATAVITDLAEQAVVAGG